MGSNSNASILGLLFFLLFFSSASATMIRAYKNETACNMCLDTASKFKDALFNSVRPRDRAWVVYERDFCISSFVEDKDKCDSDFGSFLDSMVQAYQVIYPQSELSCTTAGYCIPVDDPQPVPPTDLPSICDGIQGTLAASFPDFQAYGERLCSVLSLDYLANCYHTVDLTQSSDDFAKSCYTDARKAIGC
mmetsp:Transcript_50553/g.130298  ORF Transcript_50553/g.130298 Transcript_50553/m.130298 type:complete len:191 (-) Transcript_50553:2033-2605(-)|eukprot:CAMPEP_0113899648 /NCGR_PEP_ID=MMETSP0780_2-20120614/20171_1 /TAXON_ID=652834 /ORGANISM="Palpitomonas bilix" /LENGTH=190 /DNA_ID=CAMNT_0000891885 /DNA_START=139 /DNA_END=711 /DNA_ORIENTATION=+ /assembly_acc=CAM_ASM_000599